MPGSEKGIRCFLGVRGGVRTSELVNLPMGGGRSPRSFGSRSPLPEGLGPESGCSPTLPALPV